MVLITFHFNFNCSINIFCLFCILKFQIIFMLFEFFRKRKYSFDYFSNLKNKSCCIKRTGYKNVSIERVEWEEKYMLIWLGMFVVLLMRCIEYFTVSFVMNRMLMNSLVVVVNERMNEDITWACFNIQMDLETHAFLLSNKLVA